MQSFAEYISNNNAVFKYALGRSIEDGREFHSYYEIVYFMEGKATFVTEEMNHILSPETLIVIPKESYHQFIFENDYDYKRCLFNFFEIPQLSNLIKSAFVGTLILKPNNEIKRLFEKMISVCEREADEQTKVALMYSVLVLLTEEIHLMNEPEITGEKFDKLTNNALQYISENLCENIVISEMAEKLNVSVSTLSHTFKKDMKIPIYKFILDKKLLLAHKKINSGVPITSAAAECGFNDYSGFYRQYKKMFGVSPLKEKQSKSGK